MTLLYLLRVHVGKGIKAWAHKNGDLRLQASPTSSPVADRLPTLTPEHEYCLSGLQSVFSLYLDAAIATNCIIAIIVRAN